MKIAKEAHADTTSLPVVGHGNGTLGICCRAKEVLGCGTWRAVMARNILLPVCGGVSAYVLAYPESWEVPRSASASSGRWLLSRECRHFP